MRRLLVAATVIGLAVTLSTRPADADTSGTVTVGPAEHLLTSGNVDSVFTTFRRPETVKHTRTVRHRIRRHHPHRFYQRHPNAPRFHRHTRTWDTIVTRLYGVTSNNGVWFYRMANTGALSDRQTVMTRGTGYDQCGTHPAGSFYHASRMHIVVFYHAEQAAPGEACTTNRAEKHTRWTIREIQSYDGGHTWVKGGAVVTQDASLLTDADGAWDYGHDDAGEAHLTVRGPWMYLTYDAAPNDHTGRRESLARAPLSTLGAPGTWRKWYCSTTCGFTEPGVGGRQTPLDGLPAGTRGISWNTYLHEYLAASVHIGGGALYASHDLIHWSLYDGSVFTTGLTGSVWGDPCDPAVGEGAAFGYGSIIGVNGEPSTSGQRFYLYYMEKPAGACFGTRYLMRRLVTLPGAP